MPACPSDGQVNEAAQYCVSVGDACHDSEAILVTDTTYEEASLGTAAHPEGCEVS